MGRDYVLLDSARRRRYLPPQQGAARDNRAFDTRRRTDGTQGCCRVTWQELRRNQADDERMSDDGQLKQEGYGKYVPSSLESSHSSHSSHSSTNGLGVTGVTGVTPPLSADEANERVQRLIDEGMASCLAVAELFLISL